MVQFPSNAQIDFAACDIVIVGAGFFGSTIAHLCATLLGKRTLVLERRHHSGGNSHSLVDPDTGIEIHPYGTHIFHTNNEEVWRFLNTFSRFTNYQHRVRTVFRDKTFPMPVNLDTISQFFGKDLSPAEAADLISAQSFETIGREPANLEDKAISLVGRPLYEALVRGYTWKQWHKPPCKLPASTISRLPVRYDNEDRYFTDRYQGLPVDGYAALFDRMLLSDLIDLRLGTDFFAVAHLIPSTKLIVYTGPIDRFFRYKAGRLGWRSISLEIETLDVSDHQRIAVMNYADADVPYTRIHEFRHLHPERNYKPGKTVIAKEFSLPVNDDAEPFYPVGTSDDQNRYLAYREMARGEANVIFGGRMGTYRYIDMHQAIAAALLSFDTQIRPRLMQP